MSDSENSLLGYDSSNFIEYDEREARVLQQNQQLDNIIIELVVRMPNMITGDHPRKARRRYCDREHKQSEKRLMKDYFVENPTYDEVTFRRRFRMRKPLFLCIVHTVTANDSYFQQRRDAIGRQSLSSLQKCTAAMRVLAYGTSTDAQDEYLRISETVTRDALGEVRRICHFIFSEQYLRSPNEVDLTTLLHVGEERGFPGMIGSMDCPTGWAGQYAGRSWAMGNWEWKNRQQRTSTEYDDQPFQYSTQQIADLSSYMINRAQLRNKEYHNALKNDLIEHIWQKFGVDEKYL